MNLTRWPIEQFYLAQVALYPMRTRIVVDMRHLDNPTFTLVLSCDPGKHKIPRLPSSDAADATTIELRGRSGYVLISATIATSPKSDEYHTLSPSGSQQFPHA